MNAGCTLTVFFEDPFWVGLVERYDERGYSVARVVFGAEPTDAEIYAFTLNDYAVLPFSEALPEAQLGQLELNFKRRQREARRLRNETGTSTKAQEALKLEYERRKKVQQELSKAEREELEKQKFQIQQQRKKEKKRGH